MLCQNYAQAGGLIMVYVVYIVNKLCWVDLLKPTCLYRTSTRLIRPLRTRVTVSGRVWLNKGPCITQYNDMWDAWSGSACPHAGTWVWCQLSLLSGCDRRHETSNVRHPLHTAVDMCATRICTHTLLRAVKGGEVMNSNNWGSSPSLLDLKTLNFLALHGLKYTAFKFRAETLCVLTPVMITLDNNIACYGYLILVSIGELGWRSQSLTMHCSSFCLELCTSRNLQ
jgi:hypothetical protein